MRGKSSSSKSKNGELDIEKLKEPHLSGAYIRSLVKQLSSSRTKDLSNSKEHESVDGDGSSSQSFSGNTFDVFHDQKQEKSHQPPQQHKKQVRRRLHTSRPYQERLLNMAEARREIVTALKYHRAAMKQANESQQQQQLESGPETQPFESLSHQLSLEQEAKLKSRRNPRIYASNSSIPYNFPSSYLDNFSYAPGFVFPYSWAVPPVAPPPPLGHENFNFTLPSQTLGLNLNLQDFNTLGSNFNCGNPSSIYSSSSPSTSSSPLSAATDEIPCMGVPTSVVAEVAEFSDSGLHAAMDAQEIDEIRSIGEQYQMEWNDTLNLVNSAWWFKFLKAMEMTPENQGAVDFVNSQFDEVMEFPAWLNANESCLQNVNDFCSDNYFEDPALPCMDIGEIEGMDGDWLA